MSEGGIRAKNDFDAVMRTFNKYERLAAKETETCSKLDELT